MSKKSRRKRHIESMTDNLFRAYSKERTYHFADLPYYAKDDFFGKKGRNALKERLEYDHFGNLNSLPKDLFYLLYGFRF